MSKNNYVHSIPRSDFDDICSASLVVRVGTDSIIQVNFFRDLSGGLFYKVSDLRKDNGVMENTLPEYFTERS